MRIPFCLFGSPSPITDVRDRFFFLPDARFSCCDGVSFSAVTKMLAAGVGVLDSTAPPSCNGKGGIYGVEGGVLALLNAGLCTFHRFVRDLFMALVSCIIKWTGDGIR